MGLPPGNSKFSTDTSPVTTFFWQFPNFTATHTGVTATVGVNSVVGGGTGLATLTAGSVLVGAGTSSPTLVAPGTTGNVLTSSGGTWVSAPAGGAIFADSIVNTAGTVTLVGDVLSPTASQYYGTNGSSTRGYYNLPTVFTDPMTSTGDMIYSSSNTPTPARLPIGSTGQTLTVVGGLPTWSAVSSSTAPVTMKAHASGGESPGANNPIIFGTVIYDTASGYNISTGQYTVPTGAGGYWRIGGTFQASGTTPGNAYVAVNGAFVDYIINTGNGSFAGNVVSGWLETFVNAGDIITWATDSNVTFSNICYFIATRINTTTGSGSGITRSVSSISTATAAGATADTDYVYLVSGNTTLTLPTAVGNTNLYTVKNTDGNTTSIATTSSQTIDGSTSPITITTQYTSLDLISNGTNWDIV